MKILDLALKDLNQIFRDKRSLLFLILMPVVFTIFMGYAYGSGGNNEAQDNRLVLAWVEENQPGMINSTLYGRLETTNTIRPVRMEKNAALEALQKGELDGILLIPSSLDLMEEQNVSSQLTLLVDPNSAKGQSLYQLVRVPLSQLLSAVEIGQMNVETYGEPSAFETAFKLAWTKWTQSSVQNLVRIEQAVRQDPESWYGDNPYNQASPGILVQFAIMSLIMSAQILVDERKTRTLQRLMTTSMRFWEIIAGHLLAIYSLILLQTILLILFGQLILDVNYLREPLGTLLMAMALSSWVAATGLLIGIIAKSDDQVILYAMLAMFIFSALGGTWFPLEISGGLFAAIGRIFPSTWAMTGLQNILLRGLDLSSVWLPVLILLAYALGFFLLALWRFNKTER